MVYKVKNIVNEVFFDFNSKFVFLHVQGVDSKKKQQHTDRGQKTRCPCQQLEQEAPT